MKIMDYRIISAITEEALEALVHRHMKEGWQPLGGVSHKVESTADRGVCFVASVPFQTMVRYDALGGAGEGK